MRVDVTEDRVIMLREVFSGVLLETEEGNRLGVCMRDDTFEFSVLPRDGKRRWFRVDMQTVEVIQMEQPQ